MAERYRKTKYGIGLLAALIIIVSAAGIFWELLPYQGTIARELTRVLEENGLKVKNLEVKSANQTGAVLADISLGDEKELSVRRLELYYQIRRLIDERQAEKLIAEDIRIEVYKNEHGWTVAGLEPFLAPSDKKTGNNFAYDAAEMRKLLPASMVLNEIEIAAKDNEFSAVINLNTELSLVDKEPKLHLTGKTISANAGELTLSAEGLVMDAALSNGAWRGTAEMGKIAISGIEQDIPPLAMTGNFTVSDKNIDAELAFHDASRKWRADMAIKLPDGGTDQGSLNIRHAEFPWGGGKIAADGVKVGLAMNKPVSINLKLQDIDIGPLMDELSGEKVQGTGKLSGNIPVVYHSNGRIELKKGQAKATETGVISVSPDLLAGDNAQLEVARTALENFHYNTLTLDASSEGGKSQIKMVVEGNNPESFGGRPIKLTVNLSGDIMPLIQQSILPINDLRQLIQLQETP